MILPIPKRVAAKVHLTLLANLLRAAALLLLPLDPTAASAQSNTASIVGQALDPAGHPIPHASILLRNTDLAATRTVLTGDRGFFRLDGLSPGAFTVEATAPHLALRRPAHLTLALGSTVQLTLTLTVPPLAQKTTVTARAPTAEGNTLPPPVNKQEASLGSFFAGTVVTYLPLRDRDFTQLSQLAAGAAEDPTSRGTIVAGQRSSALLTEVDGASFNDPLHGGRRASADTTFFLPQTVVREFSIVRSGLTAEVGDTAAGLINVATKEGSNKPHGEAFLTTRPAWTTSADAFGHRLGNRQNTFGASFGGPLRRDRLFFYLGAEQDLLHAPSFTQFEPQPSSSPIPAALAALQSEIPQHSSPAALSARGDATLSPRHTVNVQLVLNRIRAADVATDTAAASSSRTTATADRATSLSGESLWTKAALTTLLNERTVNQALLSWSADHRNATPNSTAPAQVVNGFGILGGDSLGPHLYTSAQLQAADTLTVTRGSALLSLGASFSDDPAYEQQEPNLNGRFDYNSLPNYLANLPRRFRQTFLIGATRYSASLRTLGLFGNAKLPLTPRLALTAGLRYDAQFNPAPPHPNSTIPQTAHVPNDLAQIQPRIGLAWTATSRTTLRLSSGLFTAATPATLFHRVFADNGLQTLLLDTYFDPQLLPLVLAGGAHALAAPPPGLTTPAALVFGIDPSFRNPRSLQLAAAIEQELKPGQTLSAGYLHASTWRLERRLDANLSPPVASVSGLPIFPAARPNPAIGRLLIEQSSAHSSYDALLLTAASQISRRSQLSVNYTLSQTHDDDSNSGPYSIDSALNPYNLQAERAFSNLDIRHVLNIDAIFNLPLGLKCNPLFLARSGRPYTPIVGFDTQHDANDWNDRAILNGSVAARNSLRQPAFSSLDLRLVKDFTLKGAGHHLDLFMDIFNLAGASNRDFGAGSVSLFGAPGQPIASAGQPLFAPDSTRLGGPRTLQFTARLVAF